MKRNVNGALKRISLGEVNISIYIYVYVCISICIYVRP